MLRILFVAHAIVTGAAGLVLVAAPGAIPGAVGVQLGQGSFVLCYFLAGAELSIAALSLFASRTDSPEAVRLAVWTIIVFHLATGMLEVSAAALGIDAKILWNVALRVLVVAAFGYSGLFRGSKEKTS